MRAKSVHKILQKPVLKTGVHSMLYAVYHLNCLACAAHMVT